MLYPFEIGKHGNFRRWWPGLAFVALPIVTWTCIPFYSSTIKAALQIKKLSVSNTARLSKSTLSHPEPARILARIPLGPFSNGARLSRMFLDWQNHRLLIDIEDPAADSHLQFWVTGIRVRKARIFKAQNGGVQAADFQSGYIYTPFLGGITGPVGLTSLNLKTHKWAEIFHIWHGNEHVHALYTIPRKRPGLLSLILFPPFTALEDPGATLAVFQGNRLLHEAPIGRLPNSVLYLRSQDRVCLIYGKSMKSPDNRSSLLLPRSEPSTPYSHDYPLDADMTGKYIYYADPSSRILYKIRLTNGVVVASRHLRFQPQALVVDDSRHVLDLLEGNEGDTPKRVIQIRQF